jgi:hypothetical protein
MVSLHNNLIDFLSEIENSKFAAYTGDSGGYITFENTGNPVKAFTLSLESILSGIVDIETNIGAFSAHSTYDEKQWRDLGGSFFSDTALKSISTVQTKPLFTTFSKIISWANEKLYDNDNHIDLGINALAVTKEKLQQLINEYRPRQIKPEVEVGLTESNYAEILKESSLRDFALQIFIYFYGSKWKEVLERSISSVSTINNIKYEAYKFEPFTRLIAGFEEKQSKESLTSSSTQRFFDSPIYENQEKYYYFSTQWYGSGEYDLTFDQLNSFFELTYPKFKVVTKNSYFLLLEKKDTSNLFPSSIVYLPKPFILLSGISGTGKTRFVKQQSQQFKSDGSNYQLIPVRPDWQEPSDLLGYISRLGSHGAEYIVTDFLVFIVAAWKEITESINEGEIKFKTDCVPYWLCLDEMNLAPVEQYFADYLSVIETRKWEQGQYSCDALLNASVFKQLANLDSLKASLKLDDDEDGDLWAYFLSNGISIPPNLIVAGTVNMDETTHGFSRKVIDRAFTLDFGEFFPNDYDHYFEPVTQVKPFSFPRFSQVDLDLMSTVSIDVDAEKSIKFLKSINQELKSTSFELAYRALNELLIAVVCFNPEDDIALQAVWDDFLMTKVLPRIEGDSEKLQDDGEQSLLNKLEAILASQLGEIWSDDKERPDLLTEGIKGEAVQVQCRSKKKINWMQKRLNDSGFTSFWP